MNDQKSNKSSHASDHLANERTFLAWIRTSIGIMAFGFVVEKFALFINKLGLLLGPTPPQGLSETSHSLQGYSSIFGGLLVALGVLICLLAFIQYKQVEKQIEANTYRPSMALNILLMLSLLVTGIFLVFYLNSNI